MDKLTPLEEKIFDIIRKKPSLGQKELAFAANVARNTAVRAVEALIRKGILKERGYYLSDGRDSSANPLGFVLIKSPDDPTLIRKLEATLDRYISLGSWNMVSADRYDYVFFLYTHNFDPALEGFFHDIRDIIGPRSETHFLIGKPPSSRNR